MKANRIDAPTYATATANKQQWAVKLLLVGFVAVIICVLHLELGLFVSPDNSFLSGQPCLPPCWYGIIPGETSEQSAWQILQELPYVNQRLLSRQTDRRGITNIIWFSRRGGGQNRLYPRDGKIQGIFLTPHNNLNLGQVVSKLGPPEKVTARLIAAEYLDRSYVILMYYPKQGMLVSFEGEPQKQDGNLVIKPEMRVSALLYSQPSSFEDSIANARRLSQSYYWGDPANPFTQDWHGFGVYERKGSN